MCAYISYSDILVINNSSLPEILLERHCIVAEPFSISFYLQIGVELKVVSLIQWIQENCFRYGQHLITIMKKLKSKLQYNFPKDCKATATINISQEGSQPVKNNSSLNRSKDLSTLRLDNMKRFRFLKLRFFDHLLGNNKRSSPDESVAQRKRTTARSKSDNELHRLLKNEFCTRNHSRAGSLERLLDKYTPDCLPKSLQRHLADDSEATAANSPLCRSLVYPASKTCPMHDPSFLPSPEDESCAAGWYTTFGQTFRSASSASAVADDAETYTATCAVFHELNFGCESKTKSTSLWLATKSRSSPGTPYLKSAIHRPCFTGYSHFSASFTLTFVGAIEVRTSTKNLDPSTRSKLIRKCIWRVCEAAGLEPAGSGRKVQKKISSILHNSLQMPNSRKQAALTIKSCTVKLAALPSRQVFACHDIADVSYLCTGDTETPEFVAFVAKDVCKRLCYVLRCTDDKEARLILSSMSHAFDLRFRQNLERIYRGGPDLNLL